MTDVRLTALNPEDSQVYPVACNSSGELLVEKGETDEYVKVAGDNMTGDLTLGTDKITLDAGDGSASFAGQVVANVNNASGDDGALKAVQTNVNGYAIWSGSGPTASDRTFTVLPNGNVTSSGSASFAGDITQNDWSNSGVPGVRISSGNDNGFVLIKGTYNPSADSVAFAIREGGNNSNSDKISLKTNGSASFAGDVVIGSRNKQWMLVEQGGLCHMVEQVKATTADLVDQDYPKLRDVFQELNTIERCLEEVMTKLRMTQPDGWPVWDGSDNSR